MLFAILKKVLINFTTNIENASLVILKSLRRYYENKDKLSDQRKKYFEKNRDLLLAKSKVNQQNRSNKTNETS